MIDNCNISTFLQAKAASERFVPARLEPLGKCNLLQPFSASFSPLFIFSSFSFPRPLLVNNDGYGQVCLQETGEEADQEEERGDDGDHREADLAEDQLKIRRQPRLRL